GLTLPQLFDQHDALLQLRFPLLELLHLLDDRVEPRRLLLRRGDVGIELGRLVRQRPVAPADEQAGENQDQAAADGQLLRRRAERDRFFLRALALDGEEVDANHRSPALRSARPTATATDGATASGSVTPSLAGSNAILRNGSKVSTAD